MSSESKTEIFGANIAAHTEACTPIREYMYKWTIKNFSQLGNEEKTVSPNFYLDPDGEWHAEIEKNAYKQFWFNLCRHTQEPEMKVKYTITSSNLNGQVLHSECSTVDYTKDKKCHSLYLYDYIKSTDIENDAFLLTLELEITPLFVDFGLEADSTKEDCHTLNTLIKEFKELYVNPKHADCTLRVGNEDTLSVHKAILSARSPVFERLFEQKDTVEHRDTILDIDHMDMSTLKELVAFLYFGELVDYDFETAMEVYYVADNYEVMDLRQHCGDQIVEGLTRLNASRALMLAQEHNDEALKDKVCEFIIHSYQQDKRKK